ncbi:glutamate 5-kinase [Nadsonia fulvescens var. elongata DSM 6958]|uniref:Glutamate 5-kinase n=1 Tax=Nadsonia fulvescens var. elongata DSM 6958 TaxID=857566 RepID=A0A1E3PFA9_9ASCO|nr:glutamate 5-kinase [Nadsonia fulvescens var. elongata DSM 6958]
MAKKCYTIVIKLGTSSLCDEVTREPKIANMSLIVEMAVKLRRDGHRVIIVSSGGIAVGLKRMKLDKRPKHLAEVQAIAAIGQARLIGLWDSLFRQLDQPIAQILLTKNDLVDRTQYLNAANTMQGLISMGAIPIVNENDTLSVFEIKFGDNDTLSAITAGMINADYLFLMTDVDCLYTDNPRNNPDAKPVLVVDDVSKLTVDVSSAGSGVGTGGMTTKLVAAELATSAGVTTIICRSAVPGNVVSIVKYIQENDIDIDGGISGISTSGLYSTPEAQAAELARLTINNTPLHTRFLPKRNPIKDRHFWILHGLAPQGKIVIDIGAYKAVSKKRKSGLLPAGIIYIEGSFHAHQSVGLYVGQRSANSLKMDPTFEPQEVGRAMVNYSSMELSIIKGHRSQDIEKLLGYADSEYAAHRDNMAFFTNMRVHESHASLASILSDVDIEHDSLISN